MRKGGWTSRIKQDIYSEHLEGAEPWEDYNIVYMRANSSETSKGLKDRVYPELKAARDKSDHDWAMVFSIGMNDCVFSQDGYTEVSRSDYRENIEEIIEEGRKVVDQVIVVGLTPIDESILDPGQREDYYLNDEVKAFDKALKRVCMEKEVEFISVFERLRQNNWNEKLFDGLHPNTEGHEMIFEVIKDPLFDVLELDLSK